jgi:deoxyribodipyrimidine photo-lyase
MSRDLRQNFESRESLVEYLREEFSFDQDQPVSSIRGGRGKGLERLAEARLDAYDRTRNRLDGDVTGLSAYIRHGALSLSEVRDQALARRAPDKLIQELAWRDYYQRVYARIGNAIWSDREPYKTGLSGEDYADELPQDIRQGRTGTVMDVFIGDLLHTGYVHNHARMYLAAYVVHWRRIKWQAGARWFLEHLLDGDPASNNLSWQWVASTFSHKPYIFNADNLRKYAGARIAEMRELSWEPFEGSYEELGLRLFPAQRARA